MTRSFGLLSLCCTLAFGVGCDFDHDVARYRALLDGPHPAAVAPFDAAAPLPLRRALQVADRDNESIGLSGENYVQALAAKMKAAGTFLPTLSLSPTYSLSKGGGGGSGFVISGLGGTTTTGGTTGTTTGGTGGTGGQTIQITGGSSGVTHSFSVPIGASATGSLANVSTYQAAGAVGRPAGPNVVGRAGGDPAASRCRVTTTRTEGRAAGRACTRAACGSRAEKVRDQQARLKLGAVRPLDAAQSESDLASDESVNLTQARTSMRPTAAARWPG